MHQASKSECKRDTTLLVIPHAEQAQMLAALRRARYGYLLALHVLLLCAADQIRPRSRPSCSARAPVSTGLCVSIVPANSVSRLMQMGHWPPPCARPSFSPWCSALWAPYSRRRHVPMAGAGRGRVARPWRSNSRPNMAWPSRLGPCGGGSVNWAGSGNGPNWSPKMTTPSGSSAWPGFVFMRSHCTPMT